MSKAPIFLYDITFIFSQSTIDNLFEHFYLHLTNYNDGTGLFYYEGNGETYTTFNIDFNQISTEIASNNKSKLKLSNLKRTFAPILARHDNFNVGYVDITGLQENEVTGSYDVILSKHLRIGGLSTYDAEKFELELVTLTDVERNLPPIDVRELCPYELGDKYCGYVGSERHCDKTIKRCKELNNLSRFTGSFNDIE
ncbi:hypothetical protein CKF54_00500 [Psittacicella hinzii]|uniref:Bacteriophage phiJL001 Gp84 C-terminal domain-containing protein n=1 Tax=Psittacicella hinzii TaxID=2028575 RepID=A0A3A1YBF0_9GAMM|nr:hypothetical protein [Psittacicella hinzii]RIY34510.1 hypothetical protein CKF54_00500 [Psittacicella hinzii]